MPFTPATSLASLVGRAQNGLMILMSSHWNIYAALASYLLVYRYFQERLPMVARTDDIGCGRQEARFECASFLDIFIFSADYYLLMILAFLF